MRHLKQILLFGWPYLRRYWGRLVAGVLLGILFGMSNAGLVWSTKTLIGRMAPPPDASVAGVASERADAGTDRLTEITRRIDDRVKEALDAWIPRAGRGLDLRQVLGVVLFFPLFVGMRGFVGYLSAYCMGWVGERVVNDLRIDVHRKLTTLSLDFFNRSTMGDLVTRVQTDTASLQRCLRVGFPDLVRETMTLLSVFGMMLFIDWRLTLAATVFFPICVAPILVLGKKVRRASKAGREANVTQSSLLIEMLGGIRIVKAFGLEAEQAAQFRDLSHKQVHHAMKGFRAKELVNPAIEVVGMVGFGLLLVYIAFQQRGVEELAGFLAGLIFIYTPLRKLASTHVLFEQTSVGVQRLVQVLNERPTVREPERPEPLRAFQSAIRFEGVSFSYGHELVLRDVNLSIPRGTRLGIAGESGSGKSTLVNLLFRFYDPTAGAIRIDGRDLREVSLSDLRRLMALVSQEVVIFDQTAAGNIAAGRPGAGREEVESAARAAQAHEFISQLPRGYDTRLGERGVTLSGGQRQRIAVARAFIRNAPILVLDEATASLDSRSESEVQAAIDRLSENRTVICVAHRLSTLAGMDRIVVFGQGRIIEEGGYDELLRAGGAFASMARRQGITTGINSPESVPK
ncbi:MAG TPA: ABC transporter ATP-binding protein [Methylomirabilota bacterium]|nr:ABC transporter ATP-binding protein [Methylomirabilota bacterium]